LVREIKGNLHDFLDIWMDEKQLIPGDDLNSSLSGAVEDSDLVILFISQKALESDWVSKEIEWALNKEQDLGKPFLIPVILDGSVCPETLSNKLYFKLGSQSEKDINALSEELNHKLFHYAVKYGVSDTSIKTDTDKTATDKTSEAERLSTVMGFASKLIESSELDIKKKYAEIIEFNIELKPKTILLLCKSEVDNEVAELEKQEEKWQDRHNSVDNHEEDEDEEGGLGNALLVFKAISNESKMRIVKNVQRKINFVLENSEHISDEEGVYMLKKYLISSDS